MTFKQVLFSVGYPPSLNKMRTIYRGRPTLTKAAKEYKEMVGIEAFVAMAEQNVHFESKSHLVVVMHVFRPRRVGDIDNCAKLILDGMEGIVYDNDSQVVELHMFRHDDKNNPRVDIDIYMSSDQPVVKKKRVSGKAAL